MNKIFKVIWNEARNAYVVVSEIAKNHGSKSCSTKKLLAMLIATGVMTCASFDVLAAEPAAKETNKSQYVAFKDDSPLLYDGKVKEFGGYNYIYDATNKYWVREGYVLVLTATAPKGFVNTDSKDLIWDDSRQAYFYKNQRVDYSNMYVINGKLGVFTNADSTKVYTGTVYGKNNEILMTVKDKDNNFYSYWAAEVTDPSATMATYRVEEYNKNLAKLVENDDALNRNDIKEVTLTKDTNSAIIRLVRNGGNAVDGAITVTSGGGTDGSGAAHDTFVKISNGTTEQTFATGSKVEVKGPKDAITVIKVNGVDYTINNKVYTAGANVNIDENNVISATDTTYTAGNGIAIDKTNKNAISVKLKEDEKNLEVTEAGLALKKALTVESVKAGDFYMSTAGIGYGGKAYITSSGLNANSQKISGVAAGTEDTDAVNVAQLKKVSEAAASASQGWKLKTQNGNASDVKPGATVEFDGDANIQVGNDGNKVSVTLKDALTGITSITGAGAGSISFADGGKVKVNDVIIEKGGKITGVAAGEVSSTSTDAINGSQLHAVKETANKGWNLSTGKGKAVNVAPGEFVDFSGDDNIVVSNTGKNVVVKLGKELTGLTSVTTNNAYVTNVDASKNESVTNVEYVKNRIADAALSAGDGISITDKKINVKLKEGEQNLVVNQDGLSLNTTLNGMEAINGVGGGKISFSGGNVTINNNVTFNKDGRIQNVTAGTENTDAVNYGQLKDYVAANDTHITGGDYAVGEVTDNAGNKSQGVSMDIVNKEGNVTGTVTITDVAKASDVGNVTNINNDLKNPNGTTTVVDAVNNLNQKLDKKVGDLNYVEGGAETKGNYVTNGESTTVSIGKLDQALKDVATTAAKHTTVSGSSNIVVEPPTTNTDGGKNYNVKLADEITVNSVTANTFTAGQTVVMNKDGLMVGDKVSVSATAVTAGKTYISDEGVKVDGKTYISADGLNANNNKITNVVDGTVEKDSKDAINGGQLHQAKADINNRIDGVENQVISNSNRIGQLSSRVNKVGAGAAALAALHPMDFDPDDKLTFSAGYGNYGGENAAAIGAYYRPDEKVMFSVAGTVGNGENMVNAGVSFALDRTNHVSNSRTALAREVIDLRGQLAVMGAKMAKMEKALGMLDETKTKLFPDIPANHWAYEYIAKLAGNGYIEGYPDGNFGGDRLMTRYEFAAMLYRAIENGAALEEKIIKEFEPELGRIRVDRISGEDGDRDKIERVRVNDTKGERDHYGNKLAK